MWIDRQDLSWYCVTVPYTSAQKKKFVATPLVYKQRAAQHVRCALFLTGFSASDHTTALSPSPRQAPLLLRGKCITIVGITIHPHNSQGGLANDQPELGFTRRRPQTPQRRTHKAHHTRPLREAINTPQGRRCSPLFSILPHVVTYRSSSL